MIAALWFDIYRMFRYKELLVLSESSTAGGRMPMQSFNLADGIVEEFPTEILVWPYRYVVYLAERYEGEFDLYKQGTTLVYNHRQQVWHSSERIDRHKRAVAHINAQILGWIGASGTLDEMLDFLDGLWDANGKVRHYKTLSEEEKEAYRAFCFRLVKATQNALKEGKLEMGAQVAASVSVRDKLGRFNPGAIAARLVAAANRAEKLARELDHILHYISRRDMLIAGIIEAHDRDLVAHRSAVRLLKNTLTRPHVEVDAVCTQINHLIEEMQAVHFRPWRSNYWRNAGDLRAARAKLQEDTPDVASAAELVGRVDFSLWALHKIGRPYVTDVLERLTPALRYYKKAHGNREAYAKIIEACFTEVRVMVDAVPGRMAGRALEHYMRKDTIPTFIDEVIAAMKAWNRAKASKKRRAKNIELVLIHLRNAEGVW